MNGLPFVYTPRPGESVSISRDTDGRCAITVLSGSRTSSVRILASEAPGFAVMAARAICETAGKPEPVILERPEEIDAVLGRPDGTFSAGSYAFAVHDGRIDMTGPVHCMLAEEAEFVAAALAVSAAVVRRRDEPDPAEVGELAELMDAEMERRGSGQSGLYPACARIALRWMNGRQQRGESRDG